MLHADQLPLQTPGVSLLNFGSGTTVFLVQCPGAGPGGETKVLKVYRKSLGRPHDALMQQVRDRRAVYERVAQWYRSCSVVLPTHFMVLHGPLFSRPAAACIQPYVHGRKIDVFLDVSKERLVRLLREHAALRAEFRRFTDHTLRAAESEGACVDLVGRNNLVLTRAEGRLRLLLLDHGVYDFERKAIRAPSTLARIRTRLAYLQQVRDELECRQAVSSGQQGR
jgi:hypothetical protein